MSGDSSWLSDISCSSIMASASSSSGGGGSDELTQNIRDQFLQCKICLDGLKHPKTLPCLHTYCAECIVYYIEHNRLDPRKFSCPICRRHIYIPKNGVEGFPDSFFVESLTDVITRSSEKDSVAGGCGICKFKDGSVEATTLCVECKIELCASCGSSHQKAKLTKDHTLLPLSAQQGKLVRDNYCRVHRSETVKYYCETCNSPICLPCTFLDHNGHQIEEIKKVRQKFSADMEGLVVQSQDSIMSLSQARDDLSELENELFVRKEVVKTDIRRSMQELMRTLQEQEASLMTSIDEFYDTVTLGMDRQKLERTIFRLQRAHDFAKQLLSTDTSPIAQLVNRAEAKDNLNQALCYDLPDITLHGSKLTKYMYFLSGQSDLNLGSLLRCTGEGPGNSVTELSHTVPSTKAIFLHKLKTGDAEELKDVLAVGFLPSGDIAVLVSVAKKVKVFNQKGKLRYEFGEDEELLHPSDLVITKDGEIAITDCGYLLVKIFDAFGSVRNIFGSEDTFGLPISLTIDGVGRFLVCDQAKQRITIHRQNGELLQSTSINEIDIPQYISCHGNKVYICDAENKVVTIYTYNEHGLQFIAKLTAPTNGGGEFLDCSGICVDSTGSLMVSDIVLDRLHVFNARGEISSIVASGKMFLRPTCIAVTSGGLLVVAQQGITMDTDLPTSADVCLYRLVRADAC